MTAELVKNQEADLSQDTTFKLQHKPRLINELLSGDAGRVDAALSELSTDLGSSYSAVTGKDGNLLGQTQTPAQGGCYVSTKIPLLEAGATNGYFFVSRRLEKTFFNDLVERVGEQAAVSCGSDIQANTFTGGNVNANIVPVVSLLPSQESTSVLTVGDKEYLTYQFSLPVEGSDAPIVFIAGVPLETISSNRSLVLGVGLSLIGFTLGVATLLAYLVTKTITNPLRTLTKAAAEADAGNLNCHINISSHDEVGVLARSFSNMCSRLQAYIKELQESRNRMLQALTYAGDMLSSSYEREKLVKVVTETVKLATNAKASAFYLLEHEPNGVKIKPGCLIPEDFFNSERRQLIEGMIKKTDSGAIGEFAASRAGDFQLFMVPVVVKKVMLGALVAVLEDPGDSDNTTFSMMQSLAVQTATALENLKMDETLKELVITDSLTELRNIRYFNQRFSSEIELSQRHGHTMSLIVIDLDDFKQVNDTYGHQVGDEVLRQVGRLLQNNVRKSDVPARYGGEEFAVILPQTSKVMAAEVAEKLRKKTAELKIPAYPQIQISFSLGVASFPEDGADTKEILHAADHACYRAKCLGKNRTVTA